MSSSFQAAFHGSSFFIALLSNVTGYPILLVLLVPIVIVGCYYVYKTLWSILWVILQCLAVVSVTLIAVHYLAECWATPRCVISSGIWQIVAIVDSAIRQGARYWLDLEAVALGVYNGTRAEL